MREIAKKSAVDGFAAASIFLVAFLFYDLISGNYNPQLLIILGASQAVYWGSRIYYERVM